MQRPLLSVCMCFVAVMAAGILLCGTSSRGGSAALTAGAVPIEETAQEFWEQWADKTMTVTGNVYRKDSKYFYLNSVFIQNDAANLQQTIPLEENFINGNLICAYEGIAPQIGSRVILSGQVKGFRHATNPGEFDMGDYYSTLGIVGRMDESIVLMCSEDYSLWREALFTLQCYFRQRLYRILPEKEASVMTAMLLGDKQGLDDEVKELYQENGIIHILSISGLHITIIGMSIYKLLRRAGMPVWPSAVLGGSVLLLYGVMTGMSVSACRAIGMYLIKMLAEVVGRTYDMLIAMGIMAAGMVAINPLYLKSAGFLLSYAAIGGIGILYPALCEEEKIKVQRYEARVWKRIVRELWNKYSIRLKQSMSAGLSVTLTTLPIQLWFYYEVPVYSVVINLFVLPFMSFVLLAGMVAMLVPGLGVVGTVDCIVLSWYEWLCRAFKRLPFSTWNPGKPEVWQLVVYYVVLVLVVIEKDSGIVRKVWSKHCGMGNNVLLGKCGSFLRIFILTAMVSVFSLNICPETIITFLDVGQGDCICVQMASGEVYLFDCGSTDRSEVGEYVLKPYLKYCGISHIDGVFVSHADRDHCSGVEELLENSENWRISVGKLLVSGEEGKNWAEQLAAEQFHTEQFYPEQFYTEQFCEEHFLTEQFCMEQVIGAKTVQMPELIMIEAGDEWASERGCFWCLHPASDFVSEDSNANSQCFYIALEQGLTMLLTGDVEAEGEVQLLAELKRRNIHGADILKVAHHGSKNASGEAVLEQIKPQLSVISCGRDNSYGHPHMETLERLERIGSEVLTTAESGAVTIKVGKEIEVYEFVKK